MHSLEPSELSASPLASYRQLIRLVGPGYVIVAFLGRLPLAMSPLGVLLLVSSATGRYSAGGLAAGAVAVANAVGAPVAGMLADRIGQRPVVLVQSLAAATALVTLMLLVTANATLPLTLGIAAFAGVSIPHVGPLARVRWRPITKPTGTARPRLIDAAFSYEGAADEASFVLGPALVGVIAVIIEPGGALIVAAALLAVFGCWFAAHPTAKLALAKRPARTRPGRRFGPPELAILAAAQLLIGVVFGATQTGMTALATHLGNPGYAGLVYSLLAIGSVIAALSVAALPASFGYERRMIAFSAGLFVTSMPLLLVGSLAALVPVVIVLGCSVAPYMISVFALAGRIVPIYRAGTAMTILASATGIGYALGSATAGRLADLEGHRPAFAVTVAAGAAALGLALAASGRLRVATGTTRSPSH